MSTPFSYYLYHIPTQKHYYGIRYAKNCDPSELWTTYFSSSAVVKNMIREYGAESFLFQVRKTFNTGKDAIIWEHKVLRRLDAASRPEWINRHNGGKKFKGPKHHSDVTKEILRKKITGIKRNEQTIEKHRKNSKLREQQKREQNWKMPKSARESISLTLRKPEIQEKIYTPERNAKMAKSKKGTKRHYLPDGSFKMIKPQDDQ